MSVTLADLYAEHRAELVRYAAGPVGLQDAEDVVHEAFESLLRTGWKPHGHKGALKIAVSHAISHHRRRVLCPIRDVRLTVGLPRQVIDYASLEDQVCTGVVFAAFLRALTEPERRGLFRSAFDPRPIPATDRSNANKARKRLRTLQGWHG